jgi:hypothetical protein
LPPEQDNGIIAQAAEVRDKAAQGLFWVVVLTVLIARRCPFPEPAEFTGAFGAGRVVAQRSGGECMGGRAWCSGGTRAPSPNELGAVNERERRPRGRPMKHNLLVWQPEGSGYCPPAASVKQTAPSTRSRGWLFGLDAWGRCAAKRRHASFSSATDSALSHVNPRCPNLLLRVS